VGAWLLLKESGMTATVRAWTALSGFLAAFFIIANLGMAADDAPVTREQFLLLQKQNERLQRQLQQQQQLIDSLSKKVSDIQDVDRKRDRELGDLKAELKDENNAPAPSGLGRTFGKLDISGEGGIAFFQSQANGPFPHGQFRIDEARFFFEAPVWKDVYFFSEVDLTTRETTSLNLNIGELYLDWQNASRLWGEDRLLNFRAGRFYIPFGEEYQERFAIDNPLISHSVSDIWGTDDGVELYGSAGRFQYVAAVQSGGTMTSQDFTGDKSVSVRVGYDPAKWLHLSVSAMRTGDLDADRDVLSALWFGNGFAHSLGGPGTDRFHANLVEGDAKLRLPWLQLKGAGGYLGYGDNDPAGHNHRDAYYYYVEGVHDFTREFYGAARFSQVLANKGVPIVGNGVMSTDLFGPLVSDYWRLSLGLGYRFSPKMLVKAEYSFNHGREIGGATRDQEDQFSLEAAFKF
jgi:hypothetical protein